jgi:hypothetical protein
MHGQMYTYSQAAPDPGASTVGLKPNDEIRMSNDELIANDI